MEETIYFDKVELKRKMNSSGDLTYSQWNHHVTDTAQRIAIINHCTLNTQTAGGKRLADGDIRTRYQYGNHLGSTSLELDDAGAFVSYQEYYPYGTVSYIEGDVSSEYRFTGKERDELTGLYYYGARYYASWLGRWISADGLNLFAYVRGNPVTLVDPDGRESRPKAWLPEDMPQDEAEEYIRQGGSIWTRTEDEEEIRVRAQGGVDISWDDEGQFDVSADYFSIVEDGLADAGEEVVEPFVITPDSVDHAFDPVEITPLQDPAENTTDTDGSGVDGGAIAETFGKVTGIALEAGSQLYKHGADAVGNLKQIALNNPNLTTGTAKRVARSFTKHSRVLGAFSKFLSKAAIGLAAGLGAIELGSHIVEGEYAQAALTATVTTAAIVLGGVVAGASIPIALKLAAIVGVALVAEFFLWFGKWGIKKLGWR